MLNITLMVLLCVIMIYPFWYVLVLALNDARDSQMGGIWLWPRAFSLENFRFVLKSPKVANAYLISIIRTVAGTMYSLLVTGIAAYFASKRHVPFHGLILSFLMVPMFIGGTIVTNYIIIAKLGLLNNFLVYILPNGFSIFYMVIIRSFITDLPLGLEESAKLDGAGYFTIFFRIVVPLCAPVLASVALFIALAHWLDFYSNLMYITRVPRVGEFSLTTLQKLLYDVQNSLNAARDMAARARSGTLTVDNALTQMTPEAVKYATLIVTTLPILFVYPFFQKYFTKGLMLGAIKE